jgi:hypothetical protein
MGSAQLVRGGVAVAAALAVLALPANAGAGILPEEPPKADLATTGNHSELIESVPISKSAGTRERVAMSLGPDQLPRIQAGDRMRAGAEVQFSTTCVQPGPSCVGTPYRVNPTLTAQIVLAAAPDQTDSGFALSEQRTVRCKQLRPNRNHHCTIAVPNSETTISDPAALPCPTNACYANLVVEATNPRARHGNRVVLGGDRPDGSVAQDKGRLSVVHARAEVPAPAMLSSSELVNSDLPLTEGNKEKRRVIHSVAVDAPKKGDVLAFDGGWLATIDQLPFNTFLNTRVVVAESPTATGPTGLARSAVQFRGDATESNGFNCTQGPSGFATPCNVVKAGAIRITQDAVDPTTGLPVTLYVNLVAAAKPLLAKSVKNDQRVLVSPTTGLTVARFAPGA